MKIEDLHIGQCVRYQPKHYGTDKWENGRIKELRAICPDSAWVVYNCANQWDRYYDYTSAKTNLSDLKLGWRK